MAKYEVVEKSFIDGKIILSPKDVDGPEKPHIIEFDGIPGPNLRPIDEDGKKQAAKSAESNKKDAQRASRAAAGEDLKEG